MAARKTERMLNLMILLLTTRRFVTRDQIRSIIEGYDQANEPAFERQFERDKDELRALGVPIETGHNDVFFEDEVGYRISRTDFELPEIAFTADELAVLGVAARAWHNSLVSSTTRSALTKLRAAGIEPDAQRLTALAPQVSASEPPFDTLWDAATNRRRVRLRYRGEARLVDPWLLVNRKGAWYLIGFDHARGERRTFKLARIDGVPTVEGPVQAFDVPPAAELREHAARIDPATPDKVALVALAEGGAHDLRRRGRPVDVAAPQGFETLEVTYARESELIDELCAAGSAAILLAPPDLRAAVIGRLTASAGVGS